MKKFIRFAGLMLGASALVGQVTVVSPSNNASVGSPAQFVASAQSTTGYPVTAMRIYVDNTSVFLTSGGSLNTPVSLSAGRHFVVVQAWDAKGTVYKTPIYVTASGGGPGPGPGPGGIPPNAQSFLDIDQLTGWQNCDQCAGPGGHGATTPHSMTQFRSSPSIDGQSVEFWLGGSKPYSAALWWKQLGAKPAASHFAYDLDFYVTDPNAPQALEFDGNQSVGGHKYIFGTECSPRGSHQWDVWNGAHWAPTGIACAPPSAYTWHHLTWEFERTWDNKAHFIAVTLDGNKSYVNRYYNPIGSGVQELNVAFQMDGNYAEHNYSVWLDKVKLYYW